jgi:hypothetical protein
MAMQEISSFVLLKTVSGIAVSSVLFVSGVILQGNRKERD